MKYLYQLQTFSWRFLLVGAFIFLNIDNLQAEGSRDLYPAGKEGHRAVLRSDITVTVNYPFLNLGTHYVYAKVGERITMASSAQLATGPSAIRLYDPTGTRIIDDNTVAGQIPNRAAELAGPQLFGGAVAGRYTPIYHQVTVSGIYKVEFLSRSTSGEPVATVLADASWSQPSNTRAIVAWDVSVINSTNTGFVSGRVYTNVLNLSNGIGTPGTTGFYGLIYVLTEDGFQYRVSNNGNNGMYFTFFVNNNGFVDPATKNPLYKSLNTTTNIGPNINDPNTADSETQTTHKMFYSLPNSDLPLNSIGAVPGGSTWLRKLALPPRCPLSL